MIIYLDLRDLAEELDDLKSRRDPENLDEGEEPLDDDEQLRLEILIDLELQLGMDLGEYGDNEPTLIRSDSFVEYAEELAEDIGAIDRDAGWPLQYIDWEAAADALRQDYTEVDFDGDTYYVRVW
jgi:hypothetical protein